MLQLKTRAQNETPIIAMQGLVEAGLTEDSIELAEAFLYHGHRNPCTKTPWISIFGDIVSV